MNLNYNLTQASPSSMAQRQTTHSVCPPPPRPSPWRKEGPRASSAAEWSGVDSGVERRARERVGTLRDRKKRERVGTREIERRERENK